MYRHGLTWTGGLLTCAVLVTIVAGCDEPIPETFQYEVLVEGEDHGIDKSMKFYLGDEEIATVYRRYDSSSDSHTGKPYARFELPSKNSLLGRADQLAIRADTPCGPSKPTPVVLAHDPSHYHSLKNREKRAREGPQTGRIIVAVEVQESHVPSDDTRARFHFDLPTKKSTVKVGDAELDAEAGESVTVYGMDCAKKHDVELDGESIGTVGADHLLSANGASELDVELEVERVKDYEDSIPEYFVADKSACYRLGFLNYAKKGETGFASTKRQLSRRSLYQLPKFPNYLLEPAPDTISHKPLGLSTRTELVETECK